MRQTKVIINAAGIFQSDLVSQKAKQPSTEQVHLCKKWLLQYAKPKKSFNDKAFSYSLKHRVERDTGEYVTNGALIQAAVNLGYKTEVHSLNCYFNMDLFYPEDEWKRIKPEGFTAWLFKQQDKFTLARDAYADEKWPRHAVKFLEFWDYLKRYSGSWVTNELIATWRMWANEEPPIPDFELCEKFYYALDDFDFIGYEEPYEKSDKGQSYIYALVDPKKLSVRYIGKTKNPTKRLKQHILYPGSIEKAAWSGHLLFLGLCPDMAILESVNDRDVSTREMALIYSFQEYENELLLNRMTPL